LSEKGKREESARGWAGEQENGKEWEQWLPFQAEETVNAHVNLHRTFPKDPV
jgi:hypothetical protein